MDNAAQNIVASQNGFCSSVKADIWTQPSGDHAFQQWYFDALSDDGREAIFITFTDNFVFSPRYVDRSVSVPQDPLIMSEAEQVRTPAVSFVYSVDGRVELRSLCEFGTKLFKAGSAFPQVYIGNNSFELEKAEYGTGYLLKIDLPLGGADRITASLEWLSVEAELDEVYPSPAPALLWNLAAARSDVTGRIEVTDQDGRSKRLIQYRGTGYHDGISGGGSFYDAVSCRHWGRVHFTDCTAVFCVQKASETNDPEASLVISSNGSLSAREATFVAKQVRRDKLGIRYPQRLTLVSNDDCRLQVKALKTIESGFHNVRMLCEMTLILRDQKTRKAVGISEIVSPGNLKYRLFRWLTDLQIIKE